MSSWSVSGRRWQLKRVAGCAVALGVLCGGPGPLASGQSSAAPATPAALTAFRQGQAALSRNDPDAAQSAFEQAVRSSPHFEQGHAALGVLLLQRDKAGAAIQELEAARSLNKADLNVAVNLAAGYQRLGHAERAASLYALVIAGLRAGKQPVPPLVWAGYARALAATGELARAATAMRTAVQAKPGDATLRGDLGSIYAQQKDWARAETEFKAEVALDAGAALGHLRLGLAMQALAEPGAAGELQRAAQMAPGDMGIQLEWAKALAAGGDDAQAISVLEGLVGAQPASIAAEEQLAQAYQRTGRVPEAMNLFKKVVAAQPADATALTNLGMAYTQIQEAKAAVPLLQRAVALDPASATAHEDLAAAYVQLSQFGDAATELRAGLKLQPSSPQLHYDLGLALKDADDAAGAIPELQQAEKLDATAPEPPYLLGVLYLQAGRYEEAAKELQTSLHLRNENGDGWATLGSVLNRLNQLPAAVDALRQAIRQLPSQPDPHLTLAAVFAKQNLPAEAAAERKLAAELMRSHMNRQRAEVATNSGKALLNKGDLAGAAREIQEALSYDAQYPEAHLALADVYEAQGRSDEAASERGKARTAAAAHP